MITTVTWRWKNHDSGSFEKRVPKLRTNPQSRLLVPRVSKRHSPMTHREAVQNAFCILDTIMESVQKTDAVLSTFSTVHQKTPPNEPDDVPFSDPLVSPAKQTEQPPTHCFHPLPPTPINPFLPPYQAPANLPGTTARPRADGSPEPSGDLRIPLWQNETRAFQGKSVYPRKSQGLATRLASEAQAAELMVDGKPQFNLFVDGSYKSHHESRRAPEHRRFGHGGYGVVFRNPYHGKGHAEFDHNHGNLANNYFTKGTQDNLSTTQDFNIRSWHSHRVLSSLHAELVAISHGMETVTSLLKRHHPLSASVTIFTDSKTAMNRISRRPHPDGEFAITTTDALTMPLVRAIVWQSHFLFERGCELKLQWLPRCSMLAYKLADEVAGWWRKADAVLYQRNRPPWRRDGILDALHHAALVKVIERIEAEALLLLRPSSLRGPVRERRERFESRFSWANDVLLGNFFGSAVQRSLSSDSLLEMPPIWERSDAFSMVNEDMAKVLKGRPSEDN
ncbi:hypothetical protein QR685DRAFT_600400 [Neurospora intermedia]|uniref:RNase H type-1 domain-containing protein n=1 Tax=Neurospora intermedia TaxID=5142 RepID=A0ABR3D2L8_NEUIN